VGSLLKICFNEIPRFRLSKQRAFREWLAAYEKIRKTVHRTLGKLLDVNFGDTSTKKILRQEILNDEMNSVTNN
jgi:hypothetical protein